MLQVAAAPLCILVPERSLDAVGVRDVSTRAQAEAILALLEESCDVPERWPDRNASTTARVKSPELADKCLVIRDLLRHEQRSGKSLTVGESRAFEKCMDIVVQELSLALELSAEDTRALILDTLAREPQTSA